MLPNFLFGQEQVDNINGEINIGQCGKITFDDNLNFDSLIEHNAELGMSMVKIVNNCIEFDVSFGGGCGITNFELITDNAITESMSPSINVFLKLTDNDFCKAVRYRKVRFDLSGFESYKKHNGLSIRIKNNDSVVTYKE